MRFVHLADLHIGKRLKERSLFEDQAFALDAISAEIGRIAPDVVFIAGDVYDKPQPNAEAVGLFDRFLTGLHAQGVAVCMIGGNHDSQERLSFAGRILERQRLYIADAYEGSMRKVTFEDEHGPIDVYLLPHLWPREVAACFPERSIGSIGDAVQAAIEHEKVDASRRNVLLAHQFVTAVGEQPELSDSEVNPVGGLSAVDFRAFDAFCYVALGHLHGAQRVGRESVRYAGSLLRYSFSEVHQKKCFVSGEIGAQGDIAYELIPIPQLHGMRELRGEIEQLLDPEHVSRGDVNDYLHVTLTDSPLPMAPMDRLSAVFPNVLALDFAFEDRAMTEPDAAAAESKNPLELFAEFYRIITAREIEPGLQRYVQDTMDALWKEADI